MTKKEPTLLHSIKRSQLNSLHRRPNIFWSPEGLNFGRRQGIHCLYRTNRLYRRRVFGLLIFGLFISSCLFYHFFTYEYRIHRILQICNNRINSYHISSNDLISNELNREFNSKSERRLPKCIIIGVRKCGTRALLEFLNIHPSVQKASDEVHFFDDESKYSLGLDWYRNQMPYSLPEEVTIEKSPAYFVTDSVPQRIFKMNASTKLIIIVRDPVTRLISDYAQLAANKAKKERRMASFEDLILLNDGQVNTSYKAVRISLYALYYSRWTQIFPKSQVHVVDGDRLVYDPFPVVQKVEQFLGLSHRINRQNFSYNSTKGFFCVRLNGTADKCLNDSKGRRHPEINPQVIQTLRRFYAPHNRLFYRLVGKDFGWPEI